MVLRDDEDIPDDYNCVIRRLEPTRPVFVEQGLHEIIRVVVGGKEIPNIAIGEDTPLDRICRAEKSRFGPRSRSNGDGANSFTHSPACWGLDGARPRELRNEKGWLLTVQHGNEDGE